MTSCGLSSSFEPWHTFHGFLHSSPSTMFFESWRCHHHKGVFRSLVHLHVWWWRQSGLAWVLTWFYFHASWGRWVFPMIRPTCCLHTHFANLHFDGCVAYQLRACTHLSTSMISLKTISIIFDLDYLNQKQLQQWKVPHESIMDFWQCFRDLEFQALRSKIKFSYLWDWFEYFLRKYARPKKNLEILPRSTLFTNGAAQS